uniref:Cyclin-dependent kinase inhibitor 1Cb n=1 Tax=Sinocyclocheilus grahami TaxID=75366 RepID=A0A672QA90_SINGR
MSNILILNIKSMRSAETLPPAKRTETCRNLFGPVDHDELKRDLSSKLREISERDQLRWNFNFGEGRPLDGDLKWEESRAEDCPGLYRESTALPKRPLVDFPTTQNITQVPPKCGGPSVIVLNQKNQPNKCNRRKLSRKTVARVQTESLADMRITGKKCSFFFFFLSKITFLSHICHCKEVPSINVYI